MARILDEAAVRVGAQTRDGERDAGRAGERFGRRFAQGADRQVGRSRLTEKLTAQIEATSARIQRARESEAGAAAQVRVAEQRLLELRESGRAKASQILAGEERLNAARRTAARRVEDVTSATNDLERAERRLRDSHDSLLKLDPINADFERQVRAAVAKIARSLNADVPLTIRGERLRAQAAVAISEIERTLSAKIPTDPAGAVEYRRKLALLVREASRGVRANINLDVDRNGVRRAASTFAGLASTGAGAFARLGASIAGTVSSSVTNLSKLGGPVAAVGALILGIQYLLPGVAAGITLLGGSVVAAFGAISAGALGLPVLLTSLLAPIAAIALGMDGIKRAAEPVKDEFQKLKDLINITFELNMRPVFEKLQAIFPTLNVGLSETARAVSRVAMDLTTVVTSEAGIENLRVAFAGVSDMIDKSREGVAALFTSLLNVAGTRELYDILGETIGGVAFRFGNMIERVRASGSLTGALTQLRDVLFSVTDMLNVLIEGSIKFFEGAGPGLSSFFDSLTEVLSRVDWAGLGESFGGLMERLGKAIQDVPPEKWRELADAIGGLAERFIGMLEDGSLVGFISGLAGLLDELLKLGEGIGSVIDGLTLMHDKVNELDSIINDAFKSAFGGAVDWLYDFLGISSPAQKFIDIGLAVIEGMMIGLAGGPAAVFGKMRELAGKALEGLADAGTLLVEKGRLFAEGVKVGIGSKLEEVRAKTAEIKNRVLDALRGARDWLFGPGADMAEGFIRGIGSKISSVASKAAEMARSAYNAAKSALGISSPSRLFAAIGRNTVDGFLAGLRERIGPMVATIRALFAQAAQAAATSSRDGLIQAEDGSWVPRSFYGKNPVMAGVGAGLTSGVDLPTLMEGLARVLNAAELRAGRDGITLMVNDGNRVLARR